MQRPTRNDVSKTSRQYTYASWNHVQGFIVFKGLTIAIWIYIKDYNRVMQVWIKKEHLCGRVWKQKSTHTCTCRRIQKHTETFDNLYWRPKESFVSRCVWVCL